MRPSDTEIAGVLADHYCINVSEAVNWLQRSAAQGNPDGQWWLGIMLEEGRGAPKNVAEAINLYRAAAAANHPDAIAALARLEFLTKALRSAIFACN